MSTVHAAPNYAIHPLGDPPPGYPTAMVPDTVSVAPVKSTFEQRRSEFIAHILKNPSPQNTKPAWYELIRMAGGAQPHEGVFRAACDFVDARKDCSDFVLHGLLRALYQFSGEERPAQGGEFRYRYSSLSSDLLARIRLTTLNFKYFPNEPGIDSLCTWTENHYILYTSAAYLAGQLYPDEIFTNSKETGRQKMEANRPRILRWLELRYRTGFSEWLSHVYYDEDLTALLSLVDFCQDEEITQKSCMVIDLLLLDMALNSFKGVFGSTHGRSYENTKKWASNEGSTDTSKLLFGMGVYSGFDNMSAPAFALSNYRVPPVIAAIAQDTTSTIENRQRMGIQLTEMERWGIRPDNFEDGMHCLTLEAYIHPRTITNTIKMFDVCNWWENSFLQAFKTYRGLLRALNAIQALPLLARYLERDGCRNTREEVNIYTYRTPDTMLSTAQDYRKGYGGDQQHIWQASLGPDAVCFTTHPAKLDGVTPNYWAGSGLLPRAAQVKNLAIVIYKLEKIPALYVPTRHFFTHAWLPKDKFDETIEKDNWIFARKGLGYLALRSMQPYFWNEGGVSDAKSIYWRLNPEDYGREIIAAGAENIWICQLGRKAEDGEFDQFKENICKAELTFRGLNVDYQAPGIGSLSFGWEIPLYVEGVELPLSDYPRYDNPYVHGDFGSQRYAIDHQGMRLELDFEKFLREIE